MKSPAREEDKLLEWLFSLSKNNKHLRGIGDDAAIIDSDGKLLFTIDTFVEGVHFKREWSTAYQVGFKAAVATISDIAAMGGKPMSILVSIALPKGSTGVFRRITRGAIKAASIYGVSVIGGNISSAERIIVSTAGVGKAKGRIIKRSSAHKNDLVCVTNGVGESLAGLISLRRGIRRGVKGVIRKHLHPAARVAEGIIIAKYASAMMDLSDGILIDAPRLARASNVRIEILINNEAESRMLKRASSLINIKPAALVLAGGEDYEIMFTMREDALPKLRREYPDFSVIGRVKGGGRPGVKFLNEEVDEAKKLVFTHFTS